MAGFTLAASTDPATAIYMYTGGEGVGVGGGSEGSEGWGWGVEGRRGFKPPAVVVETVAPAGKYILIYCGGSLRDQKSAGFSCKREGEGVHRERERDGETDRQTNR